MTAVLDLDSLAYACGQGNKVLDEAGNPLKKDNKFVYINKTEEQLVASVDEAMNAVLTKAGADSYIAFIKGACGMRSFRHDINPAYKATRSDDVPYWWYPVFERFTERWGAIAVRDQYEVDDYVNVTRLAVPDSFIVAIDKDLLNLTGKHYNWKKDQWVTVEAFQEEYWFWKDMIVGQPGDNIKGIPGKGEVFAEKSLAYIECYRDEVLNLYSKHFGERKGIEEFYKNYMSLKLITDIEGFVTPTPIKREVATVFI